MGATSPIHHETAPLAVVMALVQGAAVLPPLATVDDIPSLQQVAFDPTIVTVPSIRDESGWISKQAFRGRLSKL